MELCQKMFEKCSEHFKVSPDSSDGGRLLSVLKRVYALDPKTQQEIVNRRRRQNYTVPGEKYLDEYIRDLEKELSTAPKPNLPSPEEVSPSPLNPTTPQESESGKAKRGRPRQRQGFQQVRLDNDLYDQIKARFGVYGIPLTVIVEKLIKTGLEKDNESILTKV